MAARTLDDEPHNRSPSPDNTQPQSTPAHFRISAASADAPSKFESLGGHVHCGTHKPMMTCIGD